MRDPSEFVTGEVGTHIMVLATCAIKEMEGVLMAGLLVHLLIYSPKGPV